MQNFRNRYTNNTIFALVFITLIVIGWLYSKSLEKKDNKELFDSSFKAVVIKKNHYRGDFISGNDIIFINTQHLIDATSELYENAKIGDTIFKLPNSNNCIVKNNDKHLKLNCYFSLSNYDE